MPDNDEERDAGPFGLCSWELLELAVETAQAEASNNYAGAEEWFDALESARLVWGRGHHYDGGDK